MAWSYPGQPIEVFASDQHSPRGAQQRRLNGFRPSRCPVALGHHRFEWLYVTAFVSPESGETLW